MGLGVVFVNQLVKWDAKLQIDLDKMLDKAKAANERRYFGTPHTLTLVFFGFIIIIWLPFFLPYGVEQ